MYLGNSLRRSVQYKSYLGESVGDTSDLIYYYPRSGLQPGYRNQILYEKSLQEKKFQYQLERRLLRNRLEEDLAHQKSKIIIQQLLAQSRKNRLTITDTDKYKANNNQRGHSYDSLQATPKSNKPQQFQSGRRQQSTKHANKPYPYPSYGSTYSYNKDNKEKEKEQYKYNKYNRYTPQNSDRKEYEPSNFDIKGIIARKLNNENDKTPVKQQYLTHKVFKQAETQLPKTQKTYQPQISQIKLTRQTTPNTQVQAESQVQSQSQHILPVTISNPTAPTSKNPQFQQQLKNLKQELQAKNSKIISLFEELNKAKDTIIKKEEDRLRDVEIWVTKQKDYERNLGEFQLMHRKRYESNKISTKTVSIYLEPSLPQHSQSPASTPTQYLKSRTLTRSNEFHISILRPPQQQMATRQSFYQTGGTSKPENLPDTKQSFFKMTNAEFKNLDMKDFQLKRDQHEVLSISSNYQSLSEFKTSGDIVESMNIDASVANAHNPKKAQPKLLKPGTINYQNLTQSIEFNQFSNSSDSRCNTEENEIDFNLSTSQMPEANTAMRKDSIKSPKSPKTPKTPINVYSPNKMNKKIAKKRSQLSYSSQLTLSASVHPGPNTPTPTITTIQLSPTPNPSFISNPSSLTPTQTGIRMHRRGSTDDDLTLSESIKVPLPSTNHRISSKQSQIIDDMSISVIREEEEQLHESNNPSNYKSSLRERRAQAEGKFDGQLGNSCGSSGGLNVESVSLTQNHHNDNDEENKNSNDSDQKIIKPIQILRIESSPKQIQQNSTVHIQTNTSNHASTITMVTNNEMVEQKGDNSISNINISESKIIDEKQVVNNGDQQKQNNDLQQKQKHLQCQKNIQGQEQLNEHKQEQNQQQQPQFDAQIPIPNLFADWQGVKLDRGDEQLWYEHQQQQNCQNLQAKQEQIQGQAQHGEEQKQQISKVINTKQELIENKGINNVNGDNFSTQQHKQNSNISDINVDITKQDVIENKNDTQILRREQQETHDQQKELDQQNKNKEIDNNSKTELDQQKQEHENHQAQFKSQDEQEPKGQQQYQVEQHGYQDQVQQHGEGLNQQQQQELNQAQNQDQPNKKQYQQQFDQFQGQEQGQQHQQQQQQDINNPHNN